MSDYVRQSTYGTNDTILAADTNDEYNKLQTAMSAAGHDHNSVDEGSSLAKISNREETVRIETEGTQGFYVNDVIQFDGSTFYQDLVEPLVHNEYLDELSLIPSGTYSVDITDGVLKSNVESIDNFNEFNSAENAKLAGAEANAGGDLTRQQALGLYVDNADTNVVSNDMFRLIDTYVFKTTKLDMEIGVVFVDSDQSTVNITVVRSGTFTEATDFRITTTDGSATAGTDYIALDNVFTFAVGATSAVATILLTAEDITQDLNFAVTLTSPDVEVVIENFMQIVSIRSVAFHDSVSDSLGNSLEQDAEIRRLALEQIILLSDGMVRQIDIDSQEVVDSFHDANQVALEVSQIATQAQLDALEIVAGAEKSLAELQAIIDAAIGPIESRVGIVETDIITLESTTDGQATTLTALIASDGNTAAQLVNLNTVSADHASALQSLGVWDPGNMQYGAIDVLSDVTTTHATYFVSLGVWDGDSFSVVDDIITVNSDQATKLSSFGTYDSGSNSYSSITDLQRTTADSASDVLVLQSGKLLTDIDGLLSAYNDFLLQNGMDINTVNVSTLVTDLSVTTSISEASAQSILGLQSSFDEASAAIIETNITVANEFAARVAQETIIEAQIGDSNANITINAEAIVTESTARATQDTQLGVDIGTAEANANTYTDVAIGYCSLTPLGTPTTHTNQTDCQNAGNVWNQGVPLAQAVQNVSVNNGTSTATVSQHLTAYETTDGQLIGRAAFELDINDRVTGIKLNGTETHTDIEFVGDTISFVNPDDFSKAFEWNATDNTFEFTGRLILTDGSVTDIADISAQDGSTWFEVAVFPSPDTGTGTIGDMYLRVGRYTNTKVVHPTLPGTYPDGIWEIGNEVDLEGPENTTPSTVPGPTGPIGAGFYRTGTGSGAWTDLTAHGATPSISPASVIGDVVTIYQTSDPSNATTKTWNGLIWTVPVLFIDGDMIATGTISGDRVVANTITANRMNWQDASSNVSVGISGNGLTVISGLASWKSLIVANTSAQSDGTIETGVTAKGSLAGVYGTGATYGLYGSSAARGVTGISTGTGSAAIGGQFSGGDFGVDAFGTVAAVEADGGTYGVRAAGTSYGLFTNSDCWFEGANYPFTGAHMSVVTRDTAKKVLGMLLVETSLISKKDISNVLFNAELTSIPRQRNVLGAISKLEKLITYPMHPYGTVDTKWRVAHKDTHQFAGVNAIGDGQLLACGEGGNIEAGDLLCSSSVAGHAMKQIDEEGNYEKYVCDYTVARARESIDFSDSLDTQMIAVIYMAG